MEATVPDSLRPIVGVDCIRIGPDGDGGYVVPRDLPAHADHLLSLGLGDDWRFEQAFLRCHAVPLTCYDHTVTGRFWVRRTLGRARRRLLRTGVADPARHNPGGTWLRYQRFFADPQRRHRRSAVGDGTAGSFTMAQILADCPGRAVFLKMDIEGAEWDTLSDIVEQRDRLVGMAIEFHEVPRRLADLERFVAALADRFAVVNIAANNVGGVVAGMPMLVELTLARRDLVTIDESLPSQDLNRRNSSLHPDVRVRFA